MISGLHTCLLNVSIEAMHAYKFYPEERSVVDINGHKINAFEFDYHIRLVRAQVEWFLENDLSENMPDIDRPWFHVNCLAEFKEKYNLEIIYEDEKTKSYA